LAATQLLELSHVDALRLFQADDETDGIVMIGEIGGTRKKKLQPSPGTM